jgi:hypothetical protein
VQARTTIPHQCTQIKEKITMCDGILIKLPDGKQFCIPLYRQELRWPPIGPDPFHHLIDDIATIATINQAIAHVRNERVRGQLVEAAQAALKTVAHQLPAGVTVGDGLTKVAAGH